MRPIARLSLLGAAALVLMQILTLQIVLASFWPARAGEPGRRAEPNATDTGIWKSYAPKGLKGELNNYDPIGLIAGARIHTDCSINYTDPDTGKVYCFNSATSLTYFEHWPKSYARRATEALRKLEEGIPTH